MIIYIFVNSLVETFNNFQVFYALHDTKGHF